jgi:ubiquinone/menaquinone biosynthesis C-methylase UbiE
MKHPILRRIPGARQWIEKIERLEDERNRLARRLRKLHARLDSLSEISPQLRRADYKAVWTQLFETESSVKLHIGGVEEELWFEVTGVATKEALVSTVGINPTDTIIEIGCRVGRVGKQIASLCRKWIGCDVSPHMLELATHRLEALNNVELHEITGFDLRPLADEVAGVVYSTVVFMHLEQWDRFNYVLEAHRVLRPEAGFLSTTSTSARTRAGRCLKFTGRSPTTCGQRISPSTRRYANSKPILSGLDLRRFAAEKSENGFKFGERNKTFSDLRF